jgi:hypothetical protein
VSTSNFAATLAVIGPCCGSATRASPEKASVGIARKILQHRLVLTFHSALPRTTLQATLVANLGALQLFVVREL